MPLLSDAQMAAPLLLIHGEERFLVDQAVHQWRQRAQTTQLDVEVLDSPANIGVIRQALTEVNLFDPERFVLIRNPPALSSVAKRGAAQAQTFAELIGERAPTTVVCLAVSAKIAPTHPVFKSLTKHGGVVLYFPALKGRDLRSWVDRNIAERKLRLERSAVDYLLRASGNDLGVICGELDKLAFFAKDNAISLDDVKQLVSGAEQVETWAIFEHLLGATPGKGAFAVEKLIKDGRAPQYLLATIAGQVFELIEAYAVLEQEGGGSGKVASAMKLPPWRAERLVTYTRSVPMNLLIEWLTELQSLDSRIKAGAIGDEEGLVTFALAAAQSLIRMRTSRQPAVSRR